jgi:hypothetical protein
MTQTYGLLSILIIGFLALLAILWFLLPFAVFGTKDKLDQLISEIIETKNEIKKISESIKQ